MGVIGDVTRPTCSLLCDRLDQQEAQREAPRAPSPDAPPQPTADELIALNPTLPIAERGREYAVFDMRGLYADRAGAP